MERSENVLRGKKLPSIVSRDGHINDRTRFDRVLKPDLRKLLRPANHRRFRKDSACGSDLRIEMRVQRGLALRAEAPRAILHDFARELRHARRRRAWPRREWKHMKVRQATFVDEVERARKHRFALG